MSINKDIDLEDIEKIKEEFNKQLEILEVARDFSKKANEICKLLYFLSDDSNNIDPADVFKVMLAYDDLHTKVKDIIDKYNINERYDQIIENGEKNMTENDKVALLETLNKISEALQYAIAAENEISDFNDVIEYHKIKLDLHATIYSLINEVELRGCKVIWEGKKAVKIVEKEDKEDDKR